MAQNDTKRRSAIDRRATRHGGYAVSLQKRKRIEESFGWGKIIGGLARPMFRGADRLRFKFTLTMASYNLIRMPKLLELATEGGSFAIPTYLGLQLPECAGNVDPAILIQTAAR